MPRERVRELIISADDLGFSPAVNAAVRCGVACGRITAASLMVNMPHAEAAVREIVAVCPNFSFGLHFTLTSGMPVSRPEDVPLLVDERGMFRHGFFGLRQLTSSFFGKHRTAALAQMKTELAAQVAKMEALAEKYSLRFDHLDSHQHVHALPGLLEMCAEEAEKRKLTLRIPREHYGTARRFLRRWGAWFPAGFLKKIILLHYTRHEKSPLLYFGVLESGKMGPAAIHEILRALAAQDAAHLTAEINIHPATELSGEAPTKMSVETHDIPACSAADKKFHASPWRQRELHAVTAPEFSAWLEKYRIRLTGFTAPSGPDLN